jgi:jasmonate ZIM domain-containing protein
LEAERAQPQLTIFYDGKTTVFDDFPADKADQLMQLAGSILTPAATSYDEPVCHNEPPYNFMAGLYNQLRIDAYVRTPRIAYLLI